MSVMGRLWWNCSIVFCATERWGEAKVKMKVRERERENIWLNKVKCFHHSQSKNSNMPTHHHLHYFFYFIFYLLGFIFFWVLPKVGRELGFGIWWWFIWSWHVSCHARGQVFGHEIFLSMGLVDFYHVKLL